MERERDEREARERGESEAREGREAKARERRGEKERESNIMEPWKCTFVTTVLFFDFVVF